MKIMNPLYSTGMALVLIGVSSYVVAATGPVVAILGIPVGGKLSTPLKKCPGNDLDSKDVAALCRTGEPLVLGEWKQWSVRIPGADTRPKWAAFANFELTINKSGLIDHFTINTYSPDDSVEIVRSVSARFGSPSSSRGKRQSFSASWIKPDVYVDVLCYEKGCKVDFMSAAAYSQWQADLTKRKKIDDARPTSL